MVAYLQDSPLDDERLAAKLQEHRAKGSSIPLLHEAMQKWYYKDPQGEIQGRSVPFTLPLLFHRTVKKFITDLFNLTSVPKDTTYPTASERGSDAGRRESS